MDTSSSNVDLEEIPLSSRYQQDELHEESPRVVNLSNGTPLRARQKPTTNIVAPAGGFESINDEGHTLASNHEGHNIASSSKMNEVIEDVVDGHACWRITGGLTIAQTTTEWYKALLVSDCKSLMEQLHKNPSLVVQTGHNGCTILHAAARRGCTPLVNQVMLQFKDHAGQFTISKDRTKILQSPLHDLFQAADFRTKLRAVEIMEYFMGSNVIRHHMAEFYDNKFSRSFRLSVGALTSHDVERRKTTHEGNKDAELDSRVSCCTYQWPTISMFLACAPPVNNKMNNVEGGGQSGITMASFKAHGETHMRSNGASKNNKKLEHGNDDIYERILHVKTKSVSFKKNTFVSSTLASTDDDHIHENLLKNICHIIDNILKNEKFKELKEQYSKDKNYNFDNTRKEFIFHYACQSMPRRSIVPGSKAEDPKYQILIGSAEDFLCSFMKECMELGEGDQKILRGSHGDKILQSLYQIKNWQGMTPCHAALSGSTSGFKNLLGLLREENDPKTIGIFLNAWDTRKWTPLHKAVAMVGGHDCWRHREFVHLLLKNEEVNLNAKLPISKATPLHLAILHNLPQVVESLIQSPKDIEGVINASLRRNIRFSNTTALSRRSSNWWSPLQLATVMGHPGVVDALITKIDMIYEVSKLKNKGVAPKTYDDKIPSIHLAAASGVPEVLQLFLDKKQKMFDPTKTTAHKRTTLHFAVDTTAPYMVDKPTCKANNFMNSFQCILDFGDAQHLEYVIIKASKKKQVVWGQVGKDHANNYQVVNLDQVTQKNNKPQLTTLKDYGGKQACISMLLQDGVDIWQRDDQRRFAEVGAETSNEIRLWWFEKIAQETFATKRILNDAANAISVVAALIATASYAGPLQPPLGFGTLTTSSYFDFVQTSSIPVQIFVVSNCLSFYLAIGSIMFAIVPSVPMPKQGIGFEEWQRSRRTVGAALSLLLLSVFCVLVSFAAASNAGMSDNNSYNHVGLAFYPAMFGGISCLIGIVVFFMGFLRFITSFGIGIKNDVKKQFASKFKMRHGKGPRQNPCEPSNAVQNTKGSQVGDVANDEGNLQHCEE